MRVAARRGSFAEPADGDARLLPDPEGERGADRDREHRGQVADHRDHPELRVGHVDVAVPAVRRAVRAAHVLRKIRHGSTPRLCGRPCRGAAACRRRPAPIAVATPTARGLVAASRVERAGNLALAVEDVAALLDPARDEHVAVDAEQVLAVESSLSHLLERADRPASRAMAIAVALSPLPSPRWERRRTGSAKSAARCSAHRWPLFSAAARLAAGSTTSRLMFRTVPAVAGALRSAAVPRVARRSPPPAVDCGSPAGHSCATPSCSGR